MGNLQGKSIGLVLSGGGIRGMAHIGFIKAMQEHGLKAGAVSGTSVGALVGALYANGNTVEDMLQFFKDTPLFQYNYFTFNKPGFIDTERYFKFFKAYFPQNTFESLQYKLYVVATDLLLGKEVVFQSGPLIYPLLASAALTPVFSPVEIQGSYFADGGVMNNFPKEYLDGSCDVIIGSNVSVAGVLRKKDLSNAWQLGARVTGLAIYASSKDKLKKCDMAIEPNDLEQIGVFDKKNIEAAFEIGYEHGHKAIAAYLS
ncbi:MAG: patatin-like phospholipase family protein [Bacteroidota bacterium]